MANPNTEEKIKEPNNRHLVGYYDVAGGDVLPSGGGEIDPSEIIDDSTSKSDATWSSSKIASEVSSAKDIDDTVIADNKTWSSSKIAGAIKVNSAPVYLGELPAGETGPCIVIKPVS